MKILARANKKLRGNGKFYTIPEPTKSWFYVTEYDSNGYPIKAKTIGCSGDMPFTYMYGGSSNNLNIITQSLQEFEINDGVTNISLFAFLNCKKLTNIIIPNSITVLDQGSFSLCSALKSLEFSSNIKTIYSDTFRYCSSCLLFDFRKATQVPTLSSTMAFYGTSSSKKIVVPDSLYDSWITATNWSSTDYNIVTSIIKASDYEASL